MMMMMMMMITIIHLNYIAVANNQRLNVLIDLMLLIYAIFSNFHILHAL